MMTSTFSSEFLVSAQDSAAFARLSGDYNPLHIDPERARRVRFGGTVTHGIHLFLRALDALAASGSFNELEPAALSASFDNPVLSGASVALHAEPQGTRIRLTASSAGRPAFSGSVDLKPAFGAAASVHDAEFEVAQPCEVSFPPAEAAGSVPLRVDRQLLATLLPSLAARPAAANWIADLLATTHIVGMRCPGMHSIYSGFKLRSSSAPEPGARTMQYRVEGMQKRFQLLRIQVAGGSLNGTLDAFFRAQPVAQRPMTEIAGLVRHGEFAGHRALVVGGSRGLGEVTAKIVAAGGADVTITYAHGYKDAQRVYEEIQALGRTCSVQHLDALQRGAGGPPQWLSSARFSHVYFFASPLIARNAGHWDDALFAKFAQVYVAAFAELVEQVLTQRADQTLPIHFFYPSSIFVAQPERGFAEYAVAKAAGEALCDQLQDRPGVRFAKPRLPRLLTDQTSSLTDIGAADPVPVMLEAIRRLHA